MTRYCSACDTHKELVEFPKNKLKHLGHGHTCKTCAAKGILKYNRTKAGVITSMYAGQKSSSIKRGMPIPTYSKEELATWLEDTQQPLFDSLLQTWKDNGYIRDDKPSIDRKDDYIGYFFDNMQLMTFQQNIDKAMRDLTSGKTTKLCTAVIATNKKTGESTEFYSIVEASRVTGADVKNIIFCCQKKPRYKSSKGFTWAYK